MIQITAARVATFILVLTSTATARAQFANIINVPPEAAPQSVGSNTQLNLFIGGALSAGFEAGSPDHTSTNVEVNINGGTVGNSFRANGGSTVNISGGIVGFDSIANSGSIVNITGGSVFPSFRAANGSVVNITGGTLGFSSQAREGSVVNISGGSVGVRFRALATSAVNLRGGTIHPNFQALTGSSVRIFGGDFRLNGVLINELNMIGNTMPIDFSGSAVLTGTFADGTPFAFGERSYDEASDGFALGTLTLERALLSPAEPHTIIASTDTIPIGIREGQTLVIDAGGVADGSFKAGWGSTVEIQPGGKLGNLEAAGAEVNMSGGSVGQIDALVGSMINIAGGSVMEVHAFAGSTVNFVGREFLFNGLPINGLIPGQPHTLTARQGGLSGILADGTAFAFSQGIRGAPYIFSSDALLTLTLVPEPMTIVLIGLAFGVIAACASRVRRD